MIKIRYCHLALIFLGSLVFPEVVLSQESSGDFGVPANGKNDDGGNLVVTGSIGIGTATPRHLLDMGKAFVDQDGAAFLNRLLMANGSTVAIDFSGRSSPTLDPQIYFGRGIFVDAKDTTDALAMRRDGEQWRMGPSTGPGDKNRFSIYSDTLGESVMTLMNSGKVGIGAVGPTQKLQVNGITRITGGNYGAGEINLDDGTEEFYGNSFQIRFERRMGDEHHFYSLKGVTAGNSLALFVDNKFDNGIFIESGGKVGIGTFHPEARLDVRGDMKISGEVRISKRQGDILMGEFVNPE
ncbi:hypothetical protein BH09VER1_BH09VER1_41140 [soil metagenome]